MNIQDLTFMPQDGLYVCEFEATGPFCIKIVRRRRTDPFDSYKMYQSMTGEDFVEVPLPLGFARQSSLEYEVPNVPAGMHIRIECGSEVLTAKIAYQL